MAICTTERVISLAVPAEHRAYALAEIREMYDWEKGWLDENGVGPEEAGADVVKERLGQLAACAASLEGCEDRLTAGATTLVRVLRAMFAHLTDELEGFAGIWRTEEIDTAKVRTHAARLLWVSDAYDAAPSIPEPWAKTEAVA
jgi:hypothetical protein